MYRSLFTGPSSVNKPPGKYRAPGHGSLSRRHKINEVLPEYLAYVLILARKTFLFVRSKLLQLIIALRR